MNQQQGQGKQPRARSRLNDAEDRLIRKVRQTKREASDGIANGLVLVLASLDADQEMEIRNIIGNVTEREQERYGHGRILDMQSDADGLWVETETEKHAQHIADAIARARNMDVESYFDDSAKQRVLSLRPK